MTYLVAQDKTGFTLVNYAQGDPTLDFFNFSFVFMIHKNVPDLNVKVGENNAFLFKIL